MSDTNNWDKARDALGVVSLVVSGLEMLDKIVSLGDKGEAALAIARAAIDKLREGISGHASPQAVLTELESLHERLADNDFTYDAALTDKFKR